jgi:hypothetical protein
MGQRHQIYVKFPGYGEKGKAKPTDGIAGFHHQWLYGMTAVNSLARVLKFYINSTDEDKDMQYGPLHSNTAYGLKRHSEVIRALYSVDVEDGYWHFVHSFLEEQDDYADRAKDYKPPSEVLDPRNGDNNDGITIIDVSHGDFRYCFMNIGHLEGEVECKTSLKPMTAAEYLLHYYPKFMQKQGNKTHDDKSKRQTIDQETFDSMIKTLALIDGNAKLLTLAECKALFPAMYKKQKER